MSAIWSRSSARRFDVIDTLYTQLGWLPAPPADFARLCRVLDESPRPGAAARALAIAALDGNQLSRLGRAIARLHNTSRDLAPLTPFKLGLLGNGTLGFLAPALVASAARHGVLLEVIQADYDQVVQEALSPDSSINQAKPDAVLIALDARGLPMRATPGDITRARETIESSMGFLNSIREGFRQNSRCICILQTLAQSPESLFGSLDRVVPGTARDLTERFNRELADSILGTQDVLLDVAALAATVGLAEWHSPAQWNLAKLPFSDTFVPLYAEHVARLIGALRGRSRRCLILDLDNTVWGGVIGDDGLENIKVAQGDPTGEAYLAVQRLALDLRERGVVLAVSSKNNDDVARSPFAKHPEMLLKETLFAVFQANWNDKATNIKAIADDLALGLDSMVFLDDNPVERGLVRQLLPDVAVPELPEDPALYARTLAAAGYFEAVAFSEEDRKRAAMYDDNARRVRLQRQVGDVDAYLASLDMVITFQPFDETGRARISQLINKSNQFNLTTRRYSEAEVAAAQYDPRTFTLQVRLADMFGDNGMICVVICRELERATWEIDTWLMSCRVLGRKVEVMVLREVLAKARAAGIERLVGVYRPTDRNSMVRDHYLKLGFRLLEEREGGETRWELPTTTNIEAAPMTVRHLELVTENA
jgi:FkbH-like protein